MVLGIHIKSMHQPTTYMILLQMLIHALGKLCPIAYGFIIIIIIIVVKTQSPLVVLSQAAWGP